ncbi:hypothetical protein [Microbacterium elymi]|uniref:Uncharacterized protein n=1 Tax=Microbacterium elymi TaxID=2909587 RepID=A0ABY5NII5_9MICO|nr:hypothetical protein [Microbacterium elymi]UUT34975.1 hypothetical protein L2X98_31935 [Microbacterium elymi]
MIEVTYWQKYCTLVLAHPVAGAVIFGLIGALIAAPYCASVILPPAFIRPSTYSCRCLVRA